MQHTDKAENSMKRINKKYQKLQYLAGVLLLGLSTCLTVPVIAEDKVPPPGQQESTWTKAGEEIGEAADAVGEASQEAWKATKETSGKVWDKTKETGSDVAEGSGEVADATVETSKTIWQKTKDTSAKWYNASKNKVHELTAPAPEK